MQGSTPARSGQHQLLRPPSPPLSLATGRVWCDTSTSGDRAGRAERFEVNYLTYGLPAARERHLLVTAEGGYYFFGGAMRRIGAALAIFLAVGAFTGAPASAAPSASPINGTWSPAVAVPGLSALSPEDVEVATSMSCTGPGDCTGGGAYQSTRDTGPSPDQAYVVSEVNGTWGNAVAVPGTVALNTGLGAATTAVSCSSPGNCVAAGYYAYRYAKTALGVAGFVANQVNGTWQKARGFPPSRVPPATPR